MKKFVISTIAAAALTVGAAGMASTASAAMPALGAKVESSAAKDGAVQNVGYYVRYRRCINYYRTYYNHYYGRYFRRYVGRRCFYFRRYYY